MLLGQYTHTHKHTHTGYGLWISWTDITTVFLCQNNNTILGNGTSIKVRLILRKCKCLSQRCRGTHTQPHTQKHTGYGRPQQKSEQFCCVKTTPHNHHQHQHHHRHQHIKTSALSITDSGPVSGTVSRTVKTNTIHTHTHLLSGGEGLLHRAGADALRQLFVDLPQLLSEHIPILSGHDHRDLGPQHAHVVLLESLHRAHRTRDTHRRSEKDNEGQDRQDNHITEKEWFLKIQFFVCTQDRNSGGAKTDT